MSETVLKFRQETDKCRIEPTNDKTDGACVATTMAPGRKLLQGLTAVAWTLPTVYFFIHGGVSWLCCGASHDVDDTTFWRFSNMWGPASTTPETRGPNKRHG